MKVSVELAGLGPTQLGCQREGGGGVGGGQHGRRKPSGATERRATASPVGPFLLPRFLGFRLGEQEQNSEG